MPENTADWPFAAVVQSRECTDAAVNCAGMLAPGEAGEIVMHGVGVVAGGRITPRGTSRILTVCGPTVPKLVLVGVAMIVTHVPGKPSHRPLRLLGGAAGAV